MSVPPCFSAAILKIFQASSLPPFSSPRLAKSNLVYSAVLRHEPERSSQNLARSRSSQPLPLDSLRDACLLPQAQDYQPKVSPKQPYPWSQLKSPAQERDSTVSLKESHPLLILPLGRLSCSASGSLGGPASWSSCLSAAQCQTQLGCPSPCSCLSRVRWSGRGEKGALHAQPPLRTSVDRRRCPLQGIMSCAATWKEKGEGSSRRLKREASQVDA